jgi:hypothetical protein
MNKTTLGGGRWFLYCERQTDRQGDKQTNKTTLGGGGLFLYGERSTDGQRDKN